MKGLFRRIHAYKMQMSAFMTSGPVNMIEVSTAFADIIYNMLMIKSRKRSSSKTLVYTVLKYELGFAYISNVCITSGMKF